MDKFKEHIQQNKEALNFDEPGTNVWACIEEQIIQPKAKVFSFDFIKATKWVAAACIIVLAGFGVKSLLQSNTKDSVQPIVQKEAVVTKQQPLAVEKKEIVEKNPIIVSAKPAVVTPRKNIDQQLETANKALNEIDNRFVQVVNYQKNKINNTPLFAENANYFLAFKEQMQQLDNDELTIRKKIKSEEFNIEFLEALITIYQQKLDVLKSLQSEINKLNNKYKQNRGPVDSTSSYFINI